MTAFTEHLSLSIFCLESGTSVVCCLLCALLLWESAGVVLLDRSQVVMQEVSCLYSTLVQEGVLLLLLVYLTLVLV